MAKTYYTEEGRAGIKLLVTAMRRNIDRVERRYRNKQTREACQAMAALCNGVFEALEEDRPFTVYLGKQLSLSFEFGEETRTHIPFSDPYESPPTLEEIEEEIRAETDPGDLDYSSSDGLYSQLD